MTPLTVAHQVPLSVEFSRQEYWSGWPHSRTSLDPGIEPTSPALTGRFFTMWATREACKSTIHQQNKMYWKREKRSPDFFLVLCLIVSGTSYQFYKLSIFLFEADLFRLPFIPVPSPVSHVDEDTVAVSVSWARNLGVIQDLCPVVTWSPAHQYQSQ